MITHADLYYKKNDGEDIEYVKVNDMFYSGEPQNGLWYVKKTRNGINFSWMNERLCDLPEAVKRAELEPYKPELARKLIKRLYEDTETIDKPVTAKEIIEMLFEVIAKGVKDE
jgi:hypothetical protein